jgi:hypothetical protein
VGRLLAAIQNFANFAEKDLFRERLVQEVGYGIENTVAGDEAIGIAGHVEDFHPLLAGEEVFGEDAAVHAGVG